MHIKIDKELVQGAYTINIKSENAPDNDFEVAVSKFTTPIVDLGGKFFEEVVTETTDEETGDVTTESKEVEVFKFAEKLVELTHEIDYTRQFKSEQYGDKAEQYANLYAKEIKSRIETALNELKSKNDSFSNDDSDIFF